MAFSERYSEDLAELKRRLKVYGSSLAVAVLFFLVCPASLDGFSGSLLGFYAPLVGKILLWVREWVLPSGVQLTPGSPSDPLQVYFFASLFLGFVLTLPIGVFELLRFVEPALGDLRMPRGVVFTAVALFLVGCLFGFFLLLPWVWYGMVVFFPVAGSQAWLVTVRDFYSLALLTTFVSGLCFETPLALWIAVARLGMDPRRLTGNRKFLWGGIYVFSAVVTPDSNFLADFVLFVPLILMVEGSLFLARRSTKKIGGAKVKWRAWRAEEWQYD